MFGGEDLRQIRTCDHLASSAPVPATSRPSRGNSAPPGLRFTYKGVGGSVKRWNRAACCMHIPKSPRPHTSDFSACLDGRWTRPELPDPTAGSPVGRRRRGEQQPAPREPSRRVGCPPGASSFPSLFPGLCSPAATLPGEDQEGGRKAPKAPPGHLSSWDGDPSDAAPPAHLSQPPGCPAPVPRPPAPLRALLQPGRRAAGGGCNKGAGEKPGPWTPKAPLTIGPPDDVLQKRVLRGHQSPPAPGHGHPPGGSGSRSCPARLLTAAGSAARGPRALPARSAPCAPQGSGRAGAAAPSRGHPRARFSPASPRPASPRTRSGLASPQPPPGGRREPGARVGGAPCRARAPRACGRRSGVSRRAGGGDPRRVGAGLAAPPSGHSREWRPVRFGQGGGRAACALGNLGGPWNTFSPLGFLCLRVEVAPP